MDKQILEKTAQELVAGGKGVWATDATDSSMDKRMEAVGIAPTPDLRRRFREILIETNGLSEFISGVILNDEIIRQETSSGVSFADFVKEKGMVPGIKVDKKTHDMANFPGEKIAEGLDGLRDRFTEYKGMGVVFTKWRVTVAIGEKIPTLTCIDSNSEVLARYAALAQEQDLVPIVEPEVLLDGNHDMKRSEEVNLHTLYSVFEFLKKHDVFMEGVILKTAWVHSGFESGEKPESTEIAEATIRVLKKSVPINIGGVVFLSGGDSPQDASDHLDKVAEMADLPWNISFSFERALEGAAMEVWGGKEENVEKARKVLLERARLNSLAKSGKYESGMESK